MPRKKDRTKEIEDSIQPESKPTVELLDSGSTLLNLALGGGYPQGKIVNIVGDNSTGKTLLMLEMLFHAKEEMGSDFIFCWDDAEDGLSFDTMAMYDYYIDKPNHSETVEELIVNVGKFLDFVEDESVPVSAYIIDSLDALSCEAELKRAAEREKALEDGKEPKGSYGMERQKLLGEFFRTTNRRIAENNCTLFIVSQVRENIGVMFGEKYRRNGGKSLDFYSAQIVWLAIAEKFKKKGIPTGVTIKAKVKKNKIGKPYRECLVPLLFDHGVDNTAGNILYACDHYTDKGARKTGALAVSSARMVSLLGGKGMKFDEAMKRINKWDIDEVQDLEQEVEDIWNGRELAAKSERKRKY